MIVDSMIFNDEFDMLEFRLKLLWDHVDKFVICEANRTHSGKLKPFYLSDSEAEYRFGWASEKIVRISVNIDISNLDLNYMPKEYEPNAPQWKIENWQRNAILDACKD